MAHILLIDDDLELTQLVTGLLETRGHVLQVAPTCARAREYLEHDRYDLIIVDGLLPDGNGTDLLLGLRREGNLTKAMFVSSSWQEVTAIAARTAELGVVRVLRKPLDPNTFPLEVSYALGPDRPPAVSSETAALLEAALGEFRQKLEVRVFAFRDTLGAARHSTDLTLLGPIHNEAHKLHGTAGSFGYQQVSDAAAQIESALASVLRTRSPLDDEAWRRIDAASARMVAALSAAPRPSSLPPVPTRVRILLVEDDALLLRALVSDLSVSLDVLTESHREGALAVARKMHPACIFIDVHLGQPYEGFELAKALRALPATERVPIVFMSADSSLDTQIGGLHAGGSLFLNKPVTAGPLLEAVRRLTEVQTARARVVLLDDDEDFCRLAERVLSRGGVTLHAIQDASLLLDTLATEMPAILLLDAHLEGVSGLDICRMLRANPRWESLDIVLVTADSSIEMRVAAFQAGASDYVSKPIVHEELLARVMSRIERRALREERATRDNLTGLMIRGPFSEAFEPMLKLAQRNARPVSVCLLDLDRFKSINDRYGHMSGDRVLATLGQLLNRRFRAEDLRCRWGGEEIVLALSDSPRNEAKLAIERLLAEFQSVTFEDATQPPYHATFSAGVASYPDDGLTLDELISVADARMYAGKRQGRARVIGQ